MHAIHKNIVTDDAMRPIAVQIDYADWVEIEQSLKLAESKAAEKEATNAPATAKKLTPACSGKAK